MSNTARVGLFLFVIWAFGFLLIGISDADRNLREWYLLIPFIAPIALIVILQIAIWIISFLQRITGRTF